ncbi:glycerophosphodiester phosphodiesterase family protein [Paenibacillus sp. P26]|nr:glycerophosphodiester phosphodiesterase family protein [Paenibacillus sp. P26]
MVIAHRGEWSDAPENSKQAVLNAMNLGVDMIEIDVQRSRDGKLIVMHDEWVDRTTNGGGRICDLTLDELLSLKLKQSQGGEAAPLTDEHVPQFKEIMSLVRNKVFINLDKCWEIREDVYQVLLETQTVKQALFKSDAELDEVEAFLNSKPIRPEYMHIIHESNAHLLRNPDVVLRRLKPKAIEFIFEEENSPFAAEAAFRLFRGKCRVWMNTMWDSLCAGHSDERSLKASAEGWGWGIERGSI